MRRIGRFEVSKCISPDDAEPDGSPDDLILELRTKDMRVLKAQLEAAIAFDEAAGTDGDESKSYTCLEIIGRAYPQTYDRPDPTTWPATVWSPEVLAEYSLPQAPPDQAPILESSGKK
ncbi:MAG: hypothetical protein ACHREM_04680 [Polyangiales bacterium]